MNSDNHFCKNHPQKVAISFCHNCGDYYCADCLNEGNTYYYCNESACYQKFIDEGGGRVKAPTSTKTKIGATIATIILFALFGTIGKVVYKELFSPSEVVSVEFSDWKTQKILNTGLSIETPFELSEGTLELPTEYRSMINKMIVYQYSSNPILINLTYAVYSDDIVPNLDGAAQGAINNMRGANEVENFTSEISNIHLNDIPGRMIKGNFKIHKQLAEYRGVIYARGLVTWQILFTYLAKKENKEVVDRIINSVKITL